MSKNFRLPNDESIFSLKSLGADLSEYRDQLAKERSARTLNLRRTNRPTIAGFLNKKSIGSASNSKLIDTSNYPFLDPYYAFGQLKKSDPKTLPSFLNSLYVCLQQTPRLANSLLKEEELPAAFNSALMNDLNEDLIIILLRTICLVFKNSSEEQQIKYIDEGLCMCLFDYLSSQSLPLLDVSLTLVDTISEASGYARDSVLCLGLHSFVIDIAKAELSEQITIKACEALNKVFSNNQSIDTNTLTSCIQPVSTLLYLNNVQAVYIVLSCFISMTNKMPALVFNMFDLDLFPLIVGFLNNQELIGVALPLIGNMSVGHLTHIKTLLECNLFDLLMQLIDTEFTADVYWVLSNILESVPHLVFGLFQHTFVQQTVEISLSSSFEVKKEAAFFIATLLLFTESEDLQYFENEELIDLLIEMLGCSSNLIVLRCLDALIRLTYIFENDGNELLSILQSRDLEQILTNLISQKSVIIKDRADFLLNRVIKT